MKAILANRAICQECETLLESYYQNDVKTCKCGSLTIEGGKDFLKRRSNVSVKIMELSILGEVVESEEMRHLKNNIHRLCQTLNLDSIDVEQAIILIQNLLAENERHRSGYPIPLVKDNNK